MNAIAAKFPAIITALTQYSGCGEFIRKVFWGFR
jgi:hypothetical protein